MKARREHIVPLPTQAIAILKSLYGFTGSRKHLFPGRDSCHKTDVYQLTKAIS